MGGAFGNVAGVPWSNHLAKWNGTAWSAFGSDRYDNGPPLYDPVYALAVSGTDLYVGGDFTDAAGIPTADYLAKWNGSAWSGSSPAVANGMVYVGSGDRKLYAYGLSGDAGVTAARRPMLADLRPR